MSKPIWIIEKKSNWGRWVRCLAGNQLLVNGFGPEELPDSLSSMPLAIAVEFNPECIDSWLNLAGKTPWKFEDALHLLLGVPNRVDTLRFCRELGFSCMVSDLLSLKMTFERYLNRVAVQDDSDLFREQMLDRIPWPES